MSTDDHQLVASGVRVSELGKVDTEVEEKPDITLETRLADFNQDTIGQDVAYYSTADVSLAESKIATAQSKNISNHLSKDMEGKSDAPAEVSIQTPRTLGLPESTFLVDKISKLEKLRNLEVTAARALETSSVHKKPEYNEESEIEGDESEIELSDDDIGAHNEFKESIDAVHHGFNNPYDPSIEETPNLPAYHPSFLNVEKLCVQLLGDAAQMLKNSEYKDAKISDLYEQAMARQTITTPKARRIGLVGDSGVGKVITSVHTEQPPLIAR